MYEFAWLATPTPNPAPADLVELLIVGSILQLGCGAGRRSGPPGPRYVEEPKPRITKKINENKMSPMVKVTPWPKLIERPLVMMTWTTMLSIEISNRSTHQHRRPTIFVRTTVAAASTDPHGWLDRGSGLMVAATTPGHTSDHAWGLTPGVIGAMMQRWGPNID